MNAGVSGDMKMRPEAVGELPRPHKVAPQPFNVLTSLIGGLQDCDSFLFYMYLLLWEIFLTFLSY
jgi:hypothetical protein